MDDVFVNSDTLPLVALRIKRYWICHCGIENVINPRISAMPKMVKCEKCHTTCRLLP